MKILGLFISIMLCCGALHAAKQSSLITASKVVAASATPEALVASATLSTELVVQAKSDNTVSAFVGPCSGSQDIELAPGASIGISEIKESASSSAYAVDLNKICLKVGVNGEGANIMYSKIVTQ